MDDGDHHVGSPPSAVREPGEDPPRELLERLAGGRCDVPPTLRPCGEEGRIAPVNLLPGHSLPLSKRQLAQPGIDLRGDAEVVGEKSGGVGCAAEVTRHEEIGDWAPPGRSEICDRTGAGLGERPVEVSHHSAPAGHGLAVPDEDEPPHDAAGQRAAKTRRMVSSASWIVAPRQSPVMPPRRARKKRPAATATAATAASAGSGLEPRAKAAMRTARAVPAATRRPETRPASGLPKPPAGRA